MDAMQIDYLSDRTDVLPILIDWFLDAWAPYYGASGPGDARRDLEARSARDRLPVGLVAMEGPRVLGTAAVGLDPATDLSPSIIGLLVGPAYRRRGVGTALIEACQTEALRLGFDEIYVSTSTLAGHFEDRGWRSCGPVGFQDATSGTIYRRPLRAGVRPRRGSRRP